MRSCQIFWTCYVTFDNVNSAFVNYVVKTGRFPESENIDELKEKLFNGVDLITADDRRWPKGMWGNPERMGKLVSIEKLDATFFGISAKQAHVMDPQSRILLEAAYECIIDAGYNPVEVRGSNTGVYIGVSESETMALLMQQNFENIDGKLQKFLKHFKYD